MVIKTLAESEAAAEEKNHENRETELQAFDETKAGVKGLVDAGITKIPKIFYAQPDNFDSGIKEEILLSIPVVDLAGINGGKDRNRRKAVVETVREASETWGFFQVVNHSIPMKVLDDMLDGVRSFYEQDNEIKKQWYTRDGSETVVYNSNFDLFRAPSANWRDTTYVNMAPNTPNPHQLPEACRYTHTHRYI